LIERGETMSARRYAKDAGPDSMSVHIERLKFKIPRVAPFDVPDGLEAVRAALLRKDKSV
jgi:hypothetical protein